MKSEAEMLKDIGKRIDCIPKETTLKDIVNYYGEDCPVYIYWVSNLTPNEQMAMGFVGKRKVERRY